MGDMLRIKRVTERVTAVLRSMTIVTTKQLAFPITDPTKGPIVVI